MNWGAIKFFVLMILIFILPLVLMWYGSAAVSRNMAQAGHRLKLIDLMTIYFVMSIHIFSEELMGQTALPYLFIFISIIGILLASLFNYYNSTFPFAHFFKVFWRLLDLMLLAGHFIFGLAFLITYWF